MLTLFVATCPLLAALPLSAQSKPPAPVPRIEPGLETAVAWKWQVIPSSEKDWGLPLPEQAAPIGIGGQTSSVGTSAAGAVTAPRPAQYEVKRGDALILIAKKFSMTVPQLKAFNTLSTDTIRIGQILKIPNAEELKTLAPPPEPEPEKKVETKKDAEPPKIAKPPAPVLGVPGQEDVLLQVFLDREQFSPGPIDGNPGATFAAVSKLYQDTHEDAKDINAFVQKARQTVGDPFTRYTLKPEDSRFIQPLPESNSAYGTKPKRSGTKASVELPPPTYEDLVTAQTLVYRTAWEFLAERFHADEGFLRRLNSRIKNMPVAGTEVLVPNVIPFEIENAFTTELQPPADPQKKVTAAVVELSRLEISQDGKLVAVLPLSLARPDLRGRGTWTILEAIPKPRLSTLQELREARAAPSLSVAEGGQEPVTPPRASLASEQYLAAGPNNPVGVVWINLAKAKSTEPLPYGLHGTSIPGRMKTQEGIGGMRLTNWDIIRAVRLLPAGTPLQWK